RYDDELWRLAPANTGPPAPHLATFVDSLPNVGHALDLGCGDGRLTAELSAESVTAADVSAVALERARQRVPGAPLVELTPAAARCSQKLRADGGSARRRPSLSARLPHPGGPQSPDARRRLHPAAGRLERRRARSRLRRGRVGRAVPRCQQRNRVARRRPRVV